jgi:hypothetical protein
VLVHSLPDDPGASCGPKPITTLLRHKEKKIGIGILKILSSSRFELKQTAVLIAHDLCLNAKNRRPWWGYAICMPICHDLTQQTILFSSYG